MRDLVLGLSLNLISPPSGIHQYAPGPPRSLTASLGREIEKFDQLCDALESRLVSVPYLTSG